MVSGELWVVLGENVVGKILNGFSCQTKKLDDVHGMCSESKYS